MAENDAPLLITVSDSSELMAAFDTIADGGRIELLAGNYSMVTLEQRSFDQGITITSANPGARAVLTEGLALDDVANVAVSGIDVIATALAPSGKFRRIDILDSEDVTLSDMTVQGHIPTDEEGISPTDPAARRSDIIAGFGFDGGLQVDRSHDITVTGLTISDTKTSIGLARSTFVTLSDLDLSETREGINMFDVSDVIIEDSHFHKMKPWRIDGFSNNDHPDMIQYWGTNAETGVHRLTIRDNLFEQRPGETHSQSIFGSMNKTAVEGVTATDFTITGNTIINWHLNAIALYDVEGAVITDNLLLPTSDQPDYPRQVHTPGIVLVNTTDVLVSRNTLLPTTNTKFVKAPREALDSGTITITDDNVWLSRDPLDPLFWRNFLPEGRTYLEQIISLYEDAGQQVIEADDEGESLRAPNEGAVLLGGDGDDSLRGGDGDDVIAGGAGADKFIFDLRGDVPANRDILTDFDFSDGDWLFVLTDVDDAFTAQGIATSSDGRGVRIYSADDLKVLVEAGDLSFVETESESVEMRVTAKPDQVLEFRGPLQPDASTPDIRPDDIEALVQAYRDADKDVINAGDEGEILVASAAGAALVGGAGGDRLNERGGDDLMIGGPGADKFVFDMRSRTDAEHDVIADLNFAEGDRLHILGPTSDAFVAPGIQNGSNGAQALLHSNEELAALLNAGEIIATETDGSVFLTTPGQPDRVLELYDYSIPIF